MCSEAVAVGQYHQKSRDWSTVAFVLAFGCQNIFKILYNTLPHP